MDNVAWTKWWNAYFRLYHKACSEGNVIIHHSFKFQNLFSHTRYNSVVIMWPERGTLSG